MNLHMKTEQMMLESLRWNEGAQRDGAVQIRMKGGKGNKMRTNKDSKVRTNEKVAGRKGGK